MTTQETVSKLMNLMAEHNYSLLEAQIRLNRELLDQIETATTLIRNSFERDGRLTATTKIER